MVKEIFVGLFLLAGLSSCQSTYSRDPVDTRTVTGGLSQSPCACLLIPQG
ncbi:MAG: hypothetical protein JJV93_02100 [Alphaproteobacteria bacterium]|nr:hypothetical protein [Alphaproteobacteria bacterium]MBL0718033.1 hypothetical protein [Alphaproteobacteria bacterium]